MTQGLQKIYQLLLRRFLASQSLVTMIEPSGPPLAREMKQGGWKDIRDDVSMLQQQLQVQNPLEKYKRNQSYLLMCETDYPPVSGHCCSLYCLIPIISLSHDHTHESDIQLETS